MTHANSITRPASAKKPEEAGLHKREQVVDKAALRKQLLQRRRDLEPTARVAWDGEIGAHLQHWCAQHKPRSLGVYWPIQAEPDLLALYPALAASGIQLALAVAHTRDAPLAFAKWTPGDAMEKDVHGIPVPASRGEDAVIRPEVLLIPCVGYTRQKFRLGYGGGYYDRTLAAAPDSSEAGAIKTLGIAYQCGQAEFDAEPHDIALDVLITEAGCLE
ncbi:5-formyltetrahydrofolate cyclo-ligase [Undibacterium sp. TJN25]|uniref:5-formyltetrahydrofolate cyclo-ligase n=1 Tax=Undibacterium sp. TJN25 TaxID=3413056 RepID=UPI003BF0E77A